MELETVNKLYLELSQFSDAVTAKEAKLLAENAALRAAMEPFARIVRESSGRIPTELLSLADWHALTKALTPNEKLTDSRP